MKSTSKSKRASNKAPKTKASSRKKAEPSQEVVQTRRLWLMYPQRLITTPIIWSLGHQFELKTNIRQASVSDEIGLVSLELEGKRREIKAAIKWLEKQGISVEPVEINVIES